MSSRYQDSYEGSFQLQEPLEITQHHGHVNLLPPDPNHPNMNFGVPRKPRGRARRVEQPWNSRMSQFSASMITAGPPNSNQQCAAPHTLSTPHTQSKIAGDGVFTPDIFGEAPGAHYNHGSGLLMTPISPEW